MLFNKKEEIISYNSYWRFTIIATAFTVDRTISSKIVNYFASRVVSEDPTILLDIKIGFLLIARYLRYSTLFNIISKFTDLLIRNLSFRVFQHIVKFKEGPGVCQVSVNS